MPNQAIYIRNPEVTETFSDSAKTVTTAGTAVQLSSVSVPVSEITIQAKLANTGNIAVGGASVTNTGGIVLTKGQTLKVNTDNLNKIWINSTVDAEGVTFVYWAN